MSMKGLWTPTKLSALLFGVVEGRVSVWMKPPTAFNLPRNAPSSILKIAVYPFDCNSRYFMDSLPHSQWLQGMLCKY